MSSTSQTLAAITRFVSIAVLTCVVTTGGFWAYQNRERLLNGSAFDGGQTGNWLTRWAGVDTTRLKVSETQKLFEEQSKLPTTIEFDASSIEQLTRPVEFDWDPRNR
jgi:hypothetical protein